MDGHILCFLSINSHFGAISYAAITLHTEGKNTSIDGDILEVLEHLAVTFNALTT